MPVFSFTAGSLGDILATAGLAARIAKALYDSTNMAKEFQSLAIELRSLQSVFILTEYAMQHASSTPLGEVLTSLLRPEVAECQLSLQQFSDNIDTCRHALFSTSIATLWKRVVWTATVEAVSLSTKLSNHRLRLSMLLITLSSIGFIDLENRVYTRLNESSAYWRCSPCSLRHVKDNTVEVVDALGDTIPVPIIFCSTWEAFHYVVVGYCKNRIGQRYIEQGDYQLVKADNHRIITRSEFSKTAREGEKFEISIVFRPNPTIEDINSRCPRCSHFDNTSIITGRWIRCFHCSGQFQVNNVFSNAQSDASYHAESDDDNDDESNEDRCITNNDQEAHEGDLELSLAMQHPRFNATQSDVSEAQFFRRITLEIQDEEQERAFRCQLRSSEQQTMSSVTSMDQQPEIRWCMRPNLIDFLVEAHYVFRLRQETLYLAVNIIDRYVSRRIVYIKHYQLLGCSALWIASKRIDTMARVPTIQDLETICCSLYDESAFIQMEGHVLSTIKWKLEHPTAWTWLRRLHRNRQQETNLHHVACFLMELTLCSREFVDHRPSSIALGALTLARCLLGIDRRPLEETAQSLDVVSLLDSHLAEYIGKLPEMLVKKYSSASFSRASTFIRQCYRQQQCQFYPLDKSVE